jgi:hypothetical protein
VAESLRIAQVRLEYTFIEQIDPGRIGELLTGPRALPDTAEPEEEKAVSRRAENTPVVACHDAVIFTGKMTVYQQRAAPER